MILPLLVMLAAPTGTQDVAPPPAERVQPAPEAIARRDRSHARLAAEGVPVNPWLPVIETAADAQRWSAAAIVDRGLALLAVSMKGGGATEAEWRGFIADHQLDGLFTPAERAFLDDKNASQQDNVAFSWRFEAACTLFWAAGLIERLDAPRETCPIDAVRKVLAPGDRAAITAAAKPRPIDAILDEADLIYRYRWALVDVQVGGKPVPEWLDGDIAMERHQAFNWLVTNPPEPWDDISLDT